MTMVAIFNARMLSPIRSRSGLSHIHMPTNSEPSSHGPIRITATADHAGQRIDRFLADALGTLSRSRVKTLIDEGRLRGDTGPVTQPAEPVQAGATYILDLPAPIPATPRPQAIPFPILYEDDDLIVLDKPAGLVVHPAPGNLDGTLVNALLAHCGPGFTGIGAERRPGIVHRLDKDTSGVMVVAKTQLANDALTTAFATRDLDRAYTRPGLGPAAAADRRDRGRHRPRPARPQAHGGGGPRRQAGTDPLPHDARLADQPRTAGMPPGHRAARIKYACISPARGTRSLAIRYTCVASRRPPRP